MTVFLRTALAPAEIADGIILDANPSEFD